MPPPAAPASAGGPPGPGAGKRLPLWAWLAAGAGGLVIGFLFLRRSPGADSDGQTDAEGGEGKPQEAAGAVVVEPLADDLLAALGLRPYTGGGTGEGGGGGGSGDGSGGGSGSGSGNGGTSAPQTAIVSQFDVGSLAPAFTSQPVFSGFTGTPTIQPFPTISPTSPSAKFVPQ